jgi:hypothetical protein
MSTELLLAHELSLENKIISANWFYTTELRFLNTQLIAMPLFKIFNSWKVVRTLQAVILYILLLLSYFYVCRKFKIERNVILFTGIFLLIPFSYTIFSIVQFGYYYIPHIIMEFVILGLLVDLARRGVLWKTLLFLFLSLICGISGIRYLLIIQLPLFAAGAISAYIRNSKTLDKKQINIKNSISIRYFIFSFASLLFAIAGYYLNDKVFSKYLHYHSYSEDRYIDINNLSERFEENIEAIVGLFGYVNRRKVVSFEGMLNAGIIFLLIMLLWFIISQVRRIKVNKNVDYDESFMLTFFCCSALITSYACLFGLDTFADRYYIPTVAIIVLIIAISWKSYFVKEKAERKIGLLLIFIVLFSSGIITLSDLKEVDTNEGRRGVTAFLEDSGYTFGLATYWNAAITTELTNGKVEIANVIDPQSLELFDWGMPVRYRNMVNEGKGDFLLLSMTEFLNADYDAKYGAENCVFNDGHFVVYKMK